MSGLLHEHSRIRQSEPALHAFTKRTELANSPQQVPIRGQHPPSDQQRPSPPNRNLRLHHSPIEQHQQLQIRSDSDVKILNTIDSKIKSPC